MIKAALILMLSASPLLGQATRAAALGDRVRVRAPKAGYGKLTGEVTATTPDAIQVRLDRGVEVDVLRAQIDELLLSLDTRRNTLRGALLGTAIAGVGAFLYGPKKVSSSQPYGAGKVSAGNVLIGAVGGGAVGALAGYYTRADRWVQLSTQP